MAETVYKIAKWDTVFETHESRKYKVLTWTSMPIGFSSHGYQKLLDQCGTDAEAIYGAWCALVSFAATLPIRGTLANSKGEPISLSHISRTTGFRVATFETLFAWAAQDSVAWLVPAESDETPQNTEENEGGRLPGESPGTPGDHREINPATRPDLTQPNLTQPDRTRPNDSQSGQSSVVDWNFDKGKIQATAHKLMRHRQVSQLSSETIWRIACLDCITGNGFAEAVKAEFISGKVQKPERYASGAIQRCCGDHLIDPVKFDAERPKLKPKPAGLA